MARVKEKRDKPKICEDAKSKIKKKDGSHISISTERQVKSRQCDKNELKLLRK